MRAEALRRRLANMEFRLQRDLKSLERIFPRVDWDNGTHATEAIRNLATAVAYLITLQAMSDFGLESEQGRHAPGDVGGPA